ncbi:MAG: hypothetical protein ACM33B_06320 [Pseudomonadota bacterium]
MSTPSTESGSPPPSGRADVTPPLGMGFLPGSAELLVWILALIVAMLVCWIADTLGAGDWMTFFLWTTSAYLLSRGIAKASRVYEM